jgi:AcrR family transcriptional regulator
MEGVNDSRAKERLTRDRICEVALEAIDEGGLDSLSMRALASALGVKASSLYYHFENKDELLTGVAEFLYRKLGRPPSDGEWTEQLKGTFLQLRDFIQAHPSAAPLLVRDLAYSPVAKKRARVLLEMCSKRGLHPDDSASLICNLVALLVGHTYLTMWLREEAASAPGDGGGPGHRVVSGELPRIWVHRLFPADSPAREDGGRGTSQERASGLDGLPGDTRFLAGLNAMVDGFVSD